MVPTYDDHHDFIYLLGYDDDDKKKMCTSLAAAGMLKRVMQHSSRLFLKSCLQSSYILVNDKIRIVEGEM